MSSPVATPKATGSYALQSELYRACLPQSSKDPTRKLIWINTVCAMFLLGGILGIAHPPGLVLQQFQAEEVQQVEIREFKPEPQTQQAAPDDEPPPDEPAPQEPVVVPPVVVAPANAAVAFAVEVKGPVIISKDPNFAVPPPRENNRRSAPVATGPRRLNTSTGGNEGRFIPEMDYPIEAKRRREQGSGEYVITVDATGGIADIRLLSSSGSSTLDNAFRVFVKKNWRLKPEDAGEWIVPFEFRLR